MTRARLLRNIKKIKKKKFDISILILSKGESSMTSRGLNRIEFSKKALRKITKKVVFENLGMKISFDNNSVGLIDRYIKNLSQILL